jgi:hypothetical protein
MEKRIRAQRIRIGDLSSSLIASSDPHGERMEVRDSNG